MNPEIYTALKRYTIMFLIATGFLVLAVTLARAEMVNLDIIAQIESGNNPKAYNASRQARGLYQITPICLKEYNNYHKNTPILSINALFKPEINRKVALWFINVRIPEMLRYYNKDYTSIKNFELYIIACYNWGIGNIIKWHKQGAKFNKLPQETQNYWRKYVAINKSKSNKF